MIHLEVEVMQLEAVPMTLLMGIKAMMLAVTADVPVGGGSGNNAVVPFRLEVSGQ